VLVAGAAMRGSWRAADVGIGSSCCCRAALVGGAHCVGPVAARALAFPIGFLYFACRSGRAQPFLQGATTAAVSVLLHASDVSALIEGNLVTIPPTVRDRAGCAGQRS